MSSIRTLAVLLLLASCNPAQRCKVQADCGSPLAYCTAGFCADGPAPGEPEQADRDGPDAGVAGPREYADAALPDGGVLEDGR
jgi:hypothetical protein